MVTRMRPSASPGVVAAVMTTGVSVAWMGFHPCWTFARWPTSTYAAPRGLSFVQLAQPRGLSESDLPLELAHYEVEVADFTSRRVLDVQKQVIDAVAVLAVAFVIREIQLGG